MGTRSSYLAGLLYNLNFTSRYFLAETQTFTAPNPSAQHVPTWPLPRRRPLPPSSTLTHHKLRDMLQNPTHAMVSSQTQPKTRITLIITHHKSEPQGHVSTLCSHNAKYDYMKVLLTTQMCEMCKPSFIANIIWEGVRGAIFYLPVLISCC